MPRRPSETVVQVNLRIKESERRRLERAAQDHHTSLNAEMAARLQQTFEQEQLGTIAQVHENLERGLLPLLGNIHELAKFGDLIRATEALILLIQPLVIAGTIGGPDAEAIKHAVAGIQTITKMIEREAGQRLRRMHTT